MKNTQDDTATEGCAPAAGYAAAIEALRKMATQESLAAMQHCLGKTDPETANMNSAALLYAAKRLIREQSKLFTAG